MASGYIFRSSDRNTSNSCSNDFESFVCPRKDATMDFFLPSFKIYTKKNNSVALHRPARPEEKAWGFAGRVTSGRLTHLLGHRIGPRVRQLQRRRAARVLPAIAKGFT